MTPEFIEKVVSLLQKHSLRAFEFEQAGARLTLKLDPERGVATDAGQANAQQKEQRNIILSPAMGVVRIKHPQRDEPFIKPGAEVKEGQIVAFLQNGELLEEVKATRSGVLVASVATDGEVVGFAQPLFELR
ncbi:hypothetical protein PSE10B_46650 [Pseudomonas amygdali pv. eriobotryae]|uniref:Biotin/lipoyl attachment domain-containing protein n=1 Tax=Pseudomonas amygdali pv. eriobotryae TaxID=129137 RepID=A0A0N8RIL3_PSEA0|nr:biotin/lipoyl-containing protein [Pseudomonas amygdali]KPX31911.1 Biotin/lipoyl attachment domain-containing protein [Pseudomonas amygdali pv. eriobotryae]KWS78367.1 hypothetical protein AL052_01155 [Pseudomonas amygdali pv. eriobotryae]RML95299.1 Biotin/lipoyl attachment domain-containing protein [Pseudomonas amygdali pv. eriobotryae]RMO48402.1 Biotin/lipoyl attachment domain-containing protein [Pseudomonas amygdali pv. eriobotryae]GFZ62797.1 hypothetical protein PSE10A_53080 [Pseudomonas 